MLSLRRPHGELPARDSLHRLRYGGCPQDIEEMKDATTAARLERVVANLELVVGRLERAAALVGEDGTTHHPPVQPPVDPEAQQAADEYLKRRVEELQEESLELARDE